MKIIAISDTHTKHRKIKELPKGDMIIHAGDVSAKGNVKSVEDFLAWFESLDYQYKLFIAGNHDFFFERESQSFIKGKIPSSVIYLNDSGVDIEGIKLWGSPIQPLFYNWAFNRRRGEAIQKHWGLIPKNTDILITHGPPHGILDQTQRGEKVGCKDLLKTVKGIQPKLHVFGHIHEAYGEVMHEQTHFVNASMMNASYQCANKPIIIDYSLL